MAKQKNVLAVPPRKKPSKKKSQEPVVIPPPLTLDEVAQFQQLPLLTLDQVGRVLQKTTAQVHEMSRARASRPLPTFRSGKSICSTWAKIQQWIDEGFAERAA
jgi:hypothetical protein